MTLPTTVPGEIYESSKLDGANKIQTLFRITITMIKPAIMSVLTLGFVYTSKVFDLVWVMTKGGPVNSTELFSTYAYRLSFEEFPFSKGAATAIAFSLAAPGAGAVQVYAKSGSALDIGRSEFKNTEYLNEIYDHSGGYTVGNMQEAIFNQDVANGGSDLTTIYPHLNGEGMTYDEDDARSLTGKITVPAGKSVTRKVVMGFVTEEIPESQTDYERFTKLESQEVVAAQKKEYNQWWSENIPYIDVPNKAVQKAIDYRWWLERFNQIDANIPGYDYQYPTTVEGVLGYNNAIILTQPCICRM